jgi:hypothetical protein
MSLMTVSTTVMTVYTLQWLHNFTNRLVISMLSKKLNVCILPNVHFFWCTVNRSQHSFSQRFAARKIFTLSFHLYENHILQRPPLVPRLGDKPTPSPKSKKSHPVLKCFLNRIKLTFRILARNYFIKQNDYFSS